MASMASSSQLFSKLSCIIFFLSLSTLASATLKVGFYQSSCPEAEAIVKNAVDCAVSPNFPSLRGFEVIDKAKAEIEAICPETVSCADILAFAARDSSYKVGGISYAVPAGRRDGRISIKEEADALPLPSFNANELINSFAQRGLSAAEMVTLSGAHSIGVAHCPTFSNRLHSFNATHSQDPSMNPSYAAYLKTKCPSSSPSEQSTVALEFSTPNRLDHRYYVELKKHRGLLSSDQTLLSSSSTSRMVLDNAKHGSKWAVEFGMAMAKMGSIDVLTGWQGEIRRHCSFQTIASFPQKPYSSMANSSSHKLSYIIFFLSLSTFASAALKVGFYRSSCPEAEAIIENVVDRAVSLLLESTPGNPAERYHPANFPTLRGFEVIDEAKAKIEAICPQTMSCADILAFAARDSANKVGGINYAVPAGRRDGCISRKEEAGTLPSFAFNAEKLASEFAKRGLSVSEMVTLSGAHSIGIAHCPTFSERLYSFNETHSQDPSMDPSYADYLKNKCPPPRGDRSEEEAVALDFSTPHRLDNRYYIELKRNRGLLTSDQTLLSSSLTSKMVLKNANDGSKWAAKFAKAMVKMGKIDVLTGSQGEIRRHCSFVN
ncbi:Peroxidase 5, partial [Cucurbita argyrosperma subsp. argyrosperma]